MRKVIYSEYVNEAELSSGKKIYSNLEEQGEALFHSWGMCIQREGEPATSSAIIELEDGTVKNIPAEQVRFISGPIVDTVTIQGSGSLGFCTIKELKKQAVKGE